MRYNYRDRKKNAVIERDLRRSVGHFIRILSAIYHALYEARYTMELHARWDDIYGRMRWCAPWDEMSRGINCAWWDEILGSEKDTASFRTSGSRHVSCA